MLIYFFIGSLVANLVYATAFIIYREQLRESRAETKRIINEILNATRKFELNTIRDAKSIFQEDEDNTNDVPTIKFPRPELKVYRDR